MHDHDQNSKGIGLSLPGGFKLTFPEPTRSAAALAWTILFMALALPGCLGRDGATFTENPISYAAPAVSGVTMTATGGTAVTFNWVTGKPARGFLQISEKGKFEADRVSSGRKAMILASKFDQGEYPGHSFDFTPVLSPTVRRDDRDVYNTLAATPGNTREAYYTFESVSDPFPVGRGGQAPTTVLDISYLHAVNIRAGNSSVLSEYLFKCSMTTSTLEKKKLSPGELKIFESLSSWTLGLTTYSSPYVADPTRFDLSFLIEAGARHGTELYFASFATGNGEPGESHSVTVKGLTRGIEYRYRVISVDPWGQATIGPEGTFKAADVLTVAASIDLGDRIRATLPSGAWVEVLNADLHGVTGTTISILDSMPQLPTGLTAFGSMYRAGTPGSFGTATIGLPMMDAPANAAIYRWNPVGGYSRIGGTVTQAGTLSVMSATVDGGGHYILAAE